MLPPPEEWYGVVVECRSILNTVRRISTISSAHATQSRTVIPHRSVGVGYRQA